EVTGQEVADLLRVAALRKGSKAHQVGEQERHEAALGDCGLVHRSRGGLRGLRSRREWGAALPAEFRGRTVGRATCGTDASQRGAAFETELAAGLVLSPAHRTAHRSPSVRELP